MLAQRGRRAPQPARDAGVAERHGGDRLAADDRVLELFEEAACGVLRVEARDARIGDRRRGDVPLRAASARRRRARGSRSTASAPPRSSGGGVRADSATHCSRPGALPAHAKSPWSAASREPLPIRPSTRPVAPNSTIASAAALSAASTIVHSTCAPRPVASRSSSATRNAQAACMPESGSHGPRWMRGWSSAWPVIHASPLSCSIVCAKPVWSRHGPESPKAGMRTRIARGFAAGIASQPRPEVLEHARREVLDHAVALRDQALARARRPRAGRGRA